MTKDDPQDSYRISPENTVAWAVAARTLQAFSRGEVTETLEHAAIRNQTVRSPAQRRSKRPAVMSEG